MSVDRSLCVFMTPHEQQPSSHPINTSLHHTPSTSVFITPHQHLSSSHPMNSSLDHTPSTPAFITPHQHLPSSHPINTSHMVSSSHPIVLNVLCPYSHCVHMSDVKLLSVFPGASCFTRHQYLKCLSLCFHVTGYCCLCFAGFGCGIKHQ